MDPSSDPPPPPPGFHFSAAPAANPSPAQPPIHSHPPYAEMIMTAISALKERNGSSRTAIAKYIETHYSSLPPTHSSLLTVHLKRLKLNGQLVMVKHSYKLPRSAPIAVNGAVDAVSSDPSSAGSKRRPGRPPKPKPDAGVAAVPVFPPSVGMHTTPDVVSPSSVAAGPVNGSSVRGRGRPRKQVGSGRGPGSPPKSGGLADDGGVVRGRGRPKKNATSAGREKGPGGPRGRPRKPVNVTEGAATVGPAAVGAANVDVVGGGGAPVAGKRRGRPPKAGGEAKTPRKLSGKAMGRPKKTKTGSQDSQLLVAYLDLQAKLENLQARVLQTATVIKPYLNSEAASNAIQELEGAAMSVSAPVDAEMQQPEVGYD